MEESSLALTVTVIPGRDVIRASVEGHVDLKHAKAAFAEAVGNPDVPGDHAVIVDARKTQAEMSTVDIWYLAAELDTTLGTAKRAALLVPLADFDKAAFLELCAQNRGLRLQAFTDFEEAFNWLLPPA